MDNFHEALLKDVFSKNKANSGNIIKAKDVEINGLAKITVDEDNLDGVKLFFKKDANDTIKEIKFVCSCGQTKSLILDYSE